jgi:hypothetical protein
MENEIKDFWQKASDIWGNSTVSIWGKLRKITIEMSVIIGSILLAQYIERIREKNHELREAKEFLLGLKDDISADVAEINDGIENYNDYKSLYGFLGNYDARKLPNKDTLNDLMLQIRGNSFLRPNTSRYEGFKSSGKLDQIDNKKLLNHILEFYQEEIPKLQSSTNAWVDYHRKLNDLMVENIVEFPNGRNNFEQIITQPKCKNLCRRLVPWTQLFERHNNVKDLGNKIIREIAKEYNL